MGAEYLGLEATGWNRMLSGWWNRVLAACLLATVVLGCVYILFLAGQKLYQYWRKRHELSVIPSAVARYLEKLRSDTKPLLAEQTLRPEPKSFGVFLGRFSSVSTPNHRRILTQWDAVVLDPLQEGVLDALAGGSTSGHILARLDLRSLLSDSPNTNNNNNNNNSNSNNNNDNTNNSIGEDDVVRALRILTATMVTFLKRPTDSHSLFNGVLLADCHDHFQPVVLNQVVRLINGLGLDVWLELAPPAYLSEKQSRDIDMTRIRGVVYRNGTILRDGDRRNYFQMTEMRAVMRVVAGQKPIGESTLAMWDTVDDTVEIPHHVLHRAYKWCNYNSAMSWIGPQSALTDVVVAAKRTVTQEPIGALMWMKGAEAMDAHEAWRDNDEVAHASCGYEELYDSLESFIPSLRDKLFLFPPDSRPRSDGRLVTVDELQWPSRKEPSSRNPFSISQDGDDYMGIGCFQLGLECTAKDVHDLLQAQRQVGELNLLDRLKPEELKRIAAPLRGLRETIVLGSEFPEASQVAEELLDLLVTCDGSDNDRIRVYSGLHSGFRTRMETQVWGLFEQDPSSGVLNIYLSGKTEDRTGALLHTYLSSRGYSRYQCFTAETVLAMANDTLSPQWHLPARLVSDIEQLTPIEALVWLRRLSLSACDECASLSARVRACCEHLLIEVPSLDQRRALSSSTYLSGEISARDLVASRLNWLHDQRCCTPAPTAAENLFLEVDERLQQLLISGDSQTLEQLATVLHTILRKGKIDAGADLLALAVFCGFRRLAADEIYLEIMDRNPLPNYNKIQAAVFAEMYALGARCDMFFDMTPKMLGKIIDAKQRAYYDVNQPPRREDGFTELPKAYASMDIDLAPEGDQQLPFHYRVTFLGIFALPALIDITMLTIVGRGLYLTTFMSDIDKTLATTALMIALLVCGGFGSWISSGGSYYLYAMAFPAMGMFVLTRFIAGFAVALVAGLSAMIGIGVVKGFAAGVLFFLYFMFLSTYLMVLSILAIYQLPGFQFQSGRTVIMSCIPILFVSPILTLWVHHDAIVYLCVLGVFLTSLLLGARRVISQWNTWFLDIPRITDGEIVSWYVQNKVSPSATMLKDLASSAEPRKAFLESVNAERSRPFWARRTKDPLVRKMADGYAATMFLLVWFCKWSRTATPLPYTPTWNLQLKAAVDTIGDMQKGLKLHNAFLHWRHTGSDVWCGVLYFIIALMDKWTALISGEALVGLSTASSSQFRLAVGFGLGYYLSGAVILDAVSQPLWTAAMQSTSEPVATLDDLRKATAHSSGAKKALYWSKLAKFFFLHIWGTAATLALMWAFEESQTATIMYLSYVGAYSGLLWYQYNRIFAGPQAAKCLALGSLVGFLTGIILHTVFPPFTWSSVIGLGAGTWTAAFYSLYMSDVGLPNFKRKFDAAKGVTLEGDPRASYTSSSLEPHLDLSQTTMADTFDSIAALPQDVRYRLDPSHHPGAEVKEILLANSGSRKSLLVQAAFPSAENLLRDTVRLWESGQTVIEFVSATHLLSKEQRVRALSKSTAARLHIFVVIGPGLVGEDWTQNIRRNCRAIAEAVVQATAEARLGLSHDHSMLAELLVVDDHHNYTLAVPEGVKYQLERSPAECARVANHGQRTFLRHLLLGLDADLQWDTLPREARSLLMRRCCGQRGVLASDELRWLHARAGTHDLQEAGEYVARYNLGAGVSLAVTAFAQRWMENEQYPTYPVFLDSTYEKPMNSLLPPPIREDLGWAEALQLSFTRIRQNSRTVIKFVILSLVADPEYQRELNYMLRGQPLFFAWPATMVLNGIWSFCKLLQQIILPLVMLHGRENVAKLYKNTKGWKSAIEKDRIVIESLSGLTTCFYRPQEDGSALLYQYSGTHATEPRERASLIAINTYTGKLILRQRDEYKGDKLLNSFSYEYASTDKKPKNKRLPIQRQCNAGELEGQVVQYDERGYMVSGSAIQGVNPVRFTYSFRKNARFDDELLRGEYIFPHVTIRVSWCMPPHNRPEREDKWIPYPRVTEATFTQGDEVHMAKWTYDHKFHPVITTTRNGEVVPTPPFIAEDWFHSLEKPSKSSFLHDNPLFFFSSARSNPVQRLLGLNVRSRPIPTSRGRTHLWKSWKASKEFDAVTATWLDEILLRRDTVLRRYWWNRDFGRLDAAGEYLDSQVDTILARVDIDPEVSSWTPLAFKISDLYSFGQGGDARINTRTLSTQIQDSDNELHVLAIDTGTWPNEPGGVSACRRDMVNDLKHIRWHIVAEAANDYGVPKFQIERNVQSLALLPQWGLDFLNPTHGVFQNYLDSAVVERSYDTREDDIERHFIPILRKLVRCARTANLTRQHIEEATNALVDLNTYFESGRSWNDVWMSDMVKHVWRELWLTQDVEDGIPVSQWWDAEHPTLAQLDNALDMWHRYLFIFSVPVPERIPDVLQVSHHFTGATYGILCKAKRKCALHVWDHCISYREMTVFLSSAVSFDSTFTNSSLMALGHLSCVLIEHHADVVLPCAEYFNPGWEIELGTAEGALEHRRAFSRKIDPVVNGITNMEKYKPIETIRTKTPTVVMLSHIRYVKDIKVAILATDLIVNKWGFSEYRLHIYGDMERAPAYASECQEIIASKGLREHVVLKGLGNPSVVLQDAWLFMNSSISEGLPLAMGEAALTGVPVVCTDVGASFCVVTDRKTGKRFSEVVAPNDADSLARAQLRVLALLENWAPFAEDAPGDIVPKLEFRPSPEEVRAISKRMHDKAELRRKFGMKGRDNVMNSFSSDRYLREHEQMLWLGKYQSHSYIARSAVSSSNSSGVLEKTRVHVNSGLFEHPPATPDSVYQPVPPRSWRALRDRYQASSSGSGTQTPV